jgi:glutathione synthetase
MLHRDRETGISSEETLFLKQVEINTTSCTGGCHATHTAQMHEYLARTGALQEYDSSLDPSSLPPNQAIKSIVSALASAHAAYGSPKSAKATSTAILMVVQPFNFNIADERPIEYALWNSNPPVPTHRCIFRPDVLTDTTLTEDRELLYHPPYREGLLPVEISTVYYRAASQEHEYDLQGQAGRLQLERSKAIKCPDILGQLSGSKIVQQALSEPGVLQKFLTNEEDQLALSNSFGHMYPLDTTALGLASRAIALDPSQAIDYVLKPNRDGGGNNIYRAAIPAYLRAQPESIWARHILMELFEPPEQQGKLMTGSGIYEGDIVSELGIIGTCLWRRGGEVLENSGAAGWTFKTKPVHVDEMSVVKGYGCFDCPRLVYEY